MAKKEKIKGLSLFSCSGIGELLLKKTQINIVVANELEEKRAKLYNYFFNETDMVVGDITKKKIYKKVIKKAKKENCKMLIATPPCQGMSLAGKMQVKDKRNYLIKYAIEAIKDLNVDFALIENVPQMYKFNINFNGELINIKKYIEKELSHKYKLSFNVLNAKDYGTPQSRKRAITLIWKEKKGEWKLPKKQKEISVKTAIGHLPSLQPGEKSEIPFHNAKNHKKEHILWLSHTPTGKTALDNKIFYPQKDNRKIKGYSTTYKRIEWDNPAPTITMCNSAISSQNNVHPGRKLKNGLFSDPRVLTLKELLILSGITEKIKLSEEFSENFVRKMIGEAVPPKFMKAIINSYPFDHQ